MGVKTYLETAIENQIIYDTLGAWCVPNIDNYSIEKNLFSYQITAIKNAICVLSQFYVDESKGKKVVLNLCRDEGFSPNSLDVNEFDGRRENPQFLRYSGFYNISRRNGTRCIDAVNFFNRICFWMATASGKTVVLIKLIEVLDYLIRNNLLPQKDFLVLLPNEKLQAQFNAAVSEYNIGKDRKIRLETLKKYDDIKGSFLPAVFNEITVFVYRSDLLSDEEKSRKIDTSSYDNGGNWYVFLDEAHKGDDDDSLRKSYISIMSRNGFLFNFSATFTDEIDYVTTCFNFNLERFIESGYGKNIYLSTSKYDAFRKNRDELTQADKQLQVLKSLLTFTLIKKAKPANLYHSPLMVTLVNEVNTQDSDTDLFFAEIAKIALNKIDSDLFERAKEELVVEFAENKQFQFGNEQLDLLGGKIESGLRAITVSDILFNVFNSKTSGSIEVIEGEKGKEFALKLVTASTPFALFRIGDASSYIRDKLSGDYRIMVTYEEKRYFDNLNNPQGDSFNLLIGSRMFYEGWDSNRPNVMNFINIGTGDAKKFVLQSLGRGVRIQPEPNNAKNRKRLKISDSRKQQLLETLFVFATNRNAVQTIFDTIETQRSAEKTIELKSQPRAFDLLIPYYKSEEIEKRPTLFNISETSYRKFVKYIDSLNDNVLMLISNIRPNEIKILRSACKKHSELFRFNSACNYVNMQNLLHKLVLHMSVFEKSVAGIRELAEEIIHFKHVKVSKDKWDSVGKQIEEFVNNAAIKGNPQQAAIDFAAGRITQDKLQQILSASSTQMRLDELTLHKLSSHYYLPLILSTREKIDYIKHIINVTGEVQFVENLISYIAHFEAPMGFDWMFSKIDQTIDDKDIAMPYYASADNMFHLFYPDFIFWLKKGSSYKIIFVDPKGTRQADYIQKIDYFEKLFLGNDQPIVFKYGSYCITFDLKLIADGNGVIPQKYKSYWLDNTNFSWLTI